MLPFNPGGHAAYQDFLVAELHKYYPSPDSIPRDAWEVMERFYLLDLSRVDLDMQDRYSVFGPRPRLPSSMLRSILLALEFGVTSYTKWAGQLKLNPLYCILSGFEFGDTPGVGTFYDFLSRLWMAEENNLASSHLRKPKSSAKKPDKKGEKAMPVDKLTVDGLLKQLQLEPPTDVQPYSRLFHLFKHVFLDQSIQKGLVTPDDLAIAGDGTPVVTSARERKKRTCSCKESEIKACDCERWFSQPDCDVGWDSSRERFYHGYNFYMLTAANSENDLPLFPLLAPASRHDSIGFLHAWFTMGAFLPEFAAKKLLLDSAHDAMPIYEYCRKERIAPFIDLNDKRGAKIKYKEDFTIGTDGIPVCKAGLKMRRDGVERAKYRAKFRCPLASRKHGCSCETPCSDSKSGRTVHLAIKDNPRIVNIPPRGSEEWKLEYNARTSAERVNKRQKIDFLLENGRHRSSKMWYCRLYGIMMLQHLNAWDLPYDSELRKRLSQAA